MELGMRISAYANPLFGESLAGLISSYIGNPQSTAQAELMAARARNENLTAKYREGMDVGLGANGANLADMMVRALQAGSEYSGNAPRVSAAISDIGSAPVTARPAAPAVVSAAAPTDEEAVLEQARAALAHAPDMKPEVIRRLTAIGIDPGRL